jgi:hypothetical protein
MESYLRKLLTEKLAKIQLRDIWITDMVDILDHGDSNA